MNTFYWPNDGLKPGDVVLVCELSSYGNRPSSPEEQAFEARSSATYEEYVVIERPSEIVPGKKIDPLPDTDYCVCIRGYDLEVVDNQTYLRRSGGDRPRILGVLDADYGSAPFLYMTGDDWDVTLFVLIPLKTPREEEDDE